MKGSNKNIDYAIKKIDEINGFLQQAIYDGAMLLECEATLERIFQDFDGEEPSV